jgi:hypothetical protein
MQIKDNPFIKCTPTIKKYHLLEKTPNLIRIRVHSFTTGVPSCDAFVIDEELIVHMPSTCSYSSVMRVSM